MKEKITIVLNEREPEKAKLAERLEVEFTSRGVPAGRIELTESLLSRLAVRAPAIVVTDYVLGDVSTGLDLLGYLRSRKSSSRVIFFTDEPSAAVALDALKNGATDYFLMNQSGVISQLVDRVVSLLSELERDTKQTSTMPKLPVISDLVTESAAARKWRGLIELAGSSSSRVTVLRGPRGAGRRFSAEAIHACRGHVVAPKVVDWELFDGSLHYAIAEHGYVILDSGDSSHAELLKALDEVDWVKLPQACLFIKTADIALEQAILKLVPDSATVSVPPLIDRIDDISGVLKANTRDISRAKTSGLSPAFITKISDIAWPGQFKQLIYTVRGALQMPGDDSDADLFEYARRLSEIEFAESPAPRVSASRARALSTIVESGSLRIAAITLGCSVTQLRSVLAGRDG